MKDYYKILGITTSCTEDEIRKSYRKLAMQYHPDRNPGDPAAEEKFKAVAVAYGVLTDPVKRCEYDACRANGTTYTEGQASGGFSYSQEDILKDLFKDPRFQQMFSGLLREFQRSGFRHSSTFVKKSFFGGKGGFIGGIFLVGSLAAPLLAGAARKGLSGKPSVIKSIGTAVGSLLGRAKSNDGPRAKATTPRHHQEDLDITYHTPLTASELRHGKTVQILVYGEEGQQTLEVKLPPGCKDGQRLRLRGKGRSGPMERGDLFLQLTKKDE